MQCSRAQRKALRCLDSREGKHVTLGMWQGFGCPRGTAWCHSASRPVTPRGGNSVRGPSDERNAPDGPVQVSPLVGLGLKPRSQNAVLQRSTCNSELFKLVGDTGT